MEKVKHLLKTLQEEYTQRNSLIKIDWRSFQTGPREGFSASYSGGTVEAQAGSYLTGAFGMAQLSHGLKSGHLADFMGESLPRFGLRPLWITSQEEFLLNSHLAGAVPGLSEEKVDFFCRRIIEMGYNAVMFGARDAAGIPKSPFAGDFSFFCRSIQAYGLKVILKVSIVPDSRQKWERSPVDPCYKRAVIESIQEFLKGTPTLDYLFWESSYLHGDFLQHPAAQEFTLAELVLAELQLIEKSLMGNCQLIFYLPSPPSEKSENISEWFSRLCDDAGNRTAIAFSAVAGDPAADHLPPHPYWEVLRRSLDCSATRLFPILNVGGVRQGEGFWPVLGFDLFEKYLPRCLRHAFGGLISLTSHLPAPGSFLDCNLWIGAQLQWRLSSPELLAETWFLANRPDLNYPKFAGLLKDIRNLTVQLSLIRSLIHEKGRDSISTEECRFISESLLAQLKALQIKSEKNEVKNRRSDKPLFADYILFFLRDARRIVLHFLQCFNIPVSSSLEGEDMHESFWTQINPGSGQGIRGVKVAFLETAAKGTPGSKMSQIYAENHFYP